MASKPFVVKQSPWWWCKNPAYRRYMLREATSIPVFAYCLLLISGVFALTQGEAAFVDWLAILRSPVSLLLHGVTFCAVLFHAYTWIELVPKILVLDKPPLLLSGHSIKRGHQLAAILGFMTLVGVVLLALTAPSSGIG